MDAITALKALRRRVEKQYTNYIGQEGRGAARMFQQETLKNIDALIAQIQTSEARGRGMR